MKRIFLIGYMGTGKTTTGRHLAKELNLNFCDLDHYIENRYLKTISQIFAEQGEAEFRKIESAMLREVGLFEDVVVATGGGAPCFFDNMDYMNSVGTTIYLKASPEALAARVVGGKNKRPLLENKSNEELLQFITDNLERREPFYSKAQITFETEHFSHKELVDEYVQKLINHL